MATFERVRRPVADVAVPRHVDEVTSQPGRPLDPVTRARLEPRFGASFGDVRVHADTRAAESARRLDAFAYTRGSHIVLDARLAPSHALLHELAHVVQQRQPLMTEAAPPARETAEAGAEAETHTAETHTAETHTAEAEAHAASARIGSGGSARISRPAGTAVQRLPRVSDWERAAADDPEAARKDQPELMNVWDRAKAATPEDAATAAAHRRQHDQHTKNQATVYAVVDAVRKEAAGGAALSTDRKLLANSVEWITAGRIDLVVLTATHDSANRAPAFGQAFFDASVAYPRLGGAYPAAPVAGSAELFYEKKAGAGGIARRHPRTGRPTIFYFPGPFEEAAEIQRVLIHEAQHLIDNSGDQALVAQHRRKTGAVAASDVSPEIIRYRSEFRAYWLSGAEPASYGGAQLSDPTFGSPDRPATNATEIPHPLAKAGIPEFRNVKPTKTKFKNERQENIFWKLATSGYGYDGAYAQSAAFQAAVDAYDRPYADNLVNSLRVDAVLTVLGWCKPTMTRDTPEVVKLFEKVALLDATDRQFLADAALSREFWERAQAALQAAVLADLTTAVKRTR